jgi:hypothetical protein
MPREPKPWFWKLRGQWVVNIGRARHYLGPDKKAAFEEFYRLMRQPAQPNVSAQSVAAIVDSFLGWVEKHRSLDTYEWYRYRLERFCQRYPELRVDQLRPYHVQEWAEGDDFSRTSRRNYLRAVKRSLIWATNRAISITTRTAETGSGLVLKMRPDPVSPDVNISRTPRC